MTSRQSPNSPSALAFATTMLFSATIPAPIQELSRTLLKTPVTINVDERLNAIVVAGGAADRKRIAELVKKLDTDIVARISEIRVVPLQYARAESLSTILNEALNTKPQPLSEQNPNNQQLLQFITRATNGQEIITSALKERVLITPDPRMNSLIVSAPVDYMPLLEQIIHRMDSHSPQIAKIRVFSLQNADVRQMSEQLTSLFRLQPAGGAATGSQRSVQIRRAVFDQ